MPKVQKRKVQRTAARPQKKVKQPKRGMVRGSGPYEYGVAGAWPSLGLKAFVKGSGPYQYVAKTAEQVPMIHRSGDKCSIAHREYLGDLLSSTGFSINTFSLNPGSAVSFPWLSGIARRFQEYKFNGLMFEFRSTSANALNSTNTALGTVILSAEYNALASAFQTKQQMENSMWAMSGKPSESLVYPIECSNLVNPLGELFVRQPGSSVTGSDSRFYDLCNVFIATQGMQAANINLGEIWISYDVDLLKPIIDPGTEIIQAQAHYSGSANSPSTMSPNPVAVNDSIGITLGTGLQIGFPAHCPGRFYISYFSTSSIAVAGLASVTMSTGGGAAPSNEFYGNTTALTQCGATQGGTSNFICACVTIADSPSTSQVNLTYGSGNFTTGSMSWDVIISSLPPNSI